MGSLVVLARDRETRLFHVEAANPVARTPCMNIISTYVLLSFLYIELIIINMES